MRYVVSFVLLALGVAVASVSGCTHMYRKDTALVPGCLPETDGGIASAPEPCRTTQVEYASRSAKEGDNFSYTLYFLEFDDQGWPYSRDAMDRVLTDIRHKVIDGKRVEHGCVDSRYKSVHVIVYVHGWKHTAEFDDSNVRSFRSVMREAATAECHELSSKREVVGIYIGWRGRPVETPRFFQFFDNFTFWDRKNVAIDVAQGNLREFFARLDAITDRANDIAARQLLRAARNSAKDQAVRQQSMSQREIAREEIMRKPVRMLMIGHSFGGHILLSALGGSTLKSLAASVDDTAATDEKCRALNLQRDGDMIVLVNPAIEAARFKPLHDVARQWRSDCYKAPILVAVTSTGDVATGRAFPLGRWFSTRLEHYESTQQEDMDRQALGHSAPLLTHDLGVRSDGKPFDTVAPPNVACQEWAGNPKLDSRVHAEFVNAEDFTRRQAAGAAPDAPRAFCAGAILVRRPEAEPEPGKPWVAPLMNIRVTPTLVENHNAIYDPRFVSFIRELYMDTLVGTFQSRR